MNENYCGVVIRINNLEKLDGLDNLKGTVIFGYQVLVGKDTEIGEKLIFFPPETQLSEGMLHYNNLYRNPDLNYDKIEKGFFETDGRVRCIKMRGNRSEGFCVKPEAITWTGYPFTSIKDGDKFDQLNGREICRKFVRKTKEKSKNGKKEKQIIKNNIEENQFRFHFNTGHMGKEMHKLHPWSLISITKKLHGTSGIFSRLLCRRRLNIFERILSLFGAKIQKNEYKTLCSSRKVIEAKGIWEKALRKIDNALQNGMTIYAEIVGYNGDKCIQKDYDYGCKQGDFDIYVYRITYTNDEGIVFEFSAQQVQEYCNRNAKLEAVPELYYGHAVNLLGDDPTTYLHQLQKRFTNKIDEKCINQVPEEGIVIRIENMVPSNNTFKLKSSEFLQLETKNLDNNVEDIEEDQ